jgi:hypothetical protein
MTWAEMRISVAVGVLPRGKRLRERREIGKGKVEEGSKARRPLSYIHARHSTFYERPSETIEFKRKCMSIPRHRRGA